MFNKKTVKDIDLKGKRVLVRVDYNVPLQDSTANGKEVVDDTRIIASLPTIKYLIEQDAKIILMSHLGRPKGERKPELSLEPVARTATLILGKEVKFSPQTVGEDVKQRVNSLQGGDILLLENLRYDKRETASDSEFSRQLAELGDVYVNDAFGTAHRAHASTVGVTEFLKPAVAGFLIEKELKYLGGALAEPQRPFTAILGGAKVSDKIPVIERLLDSVDNLLIGGGMMFTFIKASGGEIGDSLLEEDKIEVSKKFIERAKSSGKKLVIPTDTICAMEISDDANTRTVASREIPPGWKGLDIGPESIKTFRDIILTSKTILWNGPMGVFEIEQFSKGTYQIAQAVAESDSVSIVGGGDSVSAVRKSGVAERITHISTGGGASIEFLEGKQLPGIAALDDK